MRCNFKIFFLSLLIFIGLPFLASAAQLRLAWDPNTESDLVGYKVYFGTSSKQYTASVDVGNVNIYALRGLTEGQTYYIAVTAYDLYFNESVYSIEVNGVAIEPSPPISLVPPTIVPSPIPEPAPG
ncbi:MAG: fibronectin type III domain-containing protein, partial [Deltaproteobacteria bacterium]|nr:fibronectin type III domain-containing protein [Deltaproteobacteria bacterium]